MTRWYAAMFLTALTALGTSSPAAAKQPAPETELSGTMSLSVHAHSSQFTDTLFRTNPLETSFDEGDSFSYSSIPCSRPAPFNDTSLSFSPDVPGVEDPAATRHFVEGTITSTDDGGATGAVEGTITTILCLDGKRTRSTITTRFEGQFVRSSDNDLQIVGDYEILGGTGLFAGLEGSGTISGGLTCLPGTLAAQDADSCEDLGLFADAVFGLQGSFEL